jgi:hypothetical protein
MLPGVFALIAQVIILPFIAKIWFAKESKINE